MKYSFSFILQCNCFPIYAINVIGIPANSQEVKKVTVRNLNLVGGSGCLLLDSDDERDENWPAL